MVLYPSSGLYPSDGLYPGLPLVATPVAPVVAGALVLCDQDGNEVAELEVDHSFRFERSRAASVKFALGYDQTGARELADILGDGIPQARAYRRSNGITSLIFNGIWAPQQDSADGSDTDAITCEFRSPFSILENRYLDAAKTYTGKDAGDIVWDLLTAANGDFETGILQGVLESTVSRNETYDVGQQLASAITDLADLSDGFQFTETPLEPGSGGLSALNIWADLGRDATGTVRFEFGESTIANVISVERTTSYPVNRAIVVGGGSTTPSIANDVLSQGVYGLFAATDSFTDITVQSMLDEKAASMLQRYPVEEIAFVPDADNQQQPFDDYWLGDRVSFYADQDGLQIDATPLVAAIEIDRDGSGEELEHRIEFGDQHVVPQPVVPVRKGHRVVFRHHKRTGGGSSKYHQQTFSQHKRYLLLGSGGAGLTPTVRSRKRHRAPGVTPHHSGGSGLG